MAGYTVVERSRNDRSEIIKPLESDRTRLLPAVKTANLNLQTTNTLFDPTYADVDKIYAQPCFFFFICHFELGRKLVARNCPNVPTTLFHLESRHMGNYLVRETATWKPNKRDSKTGEKTSDRKPRWVFRATRFFLWWAEPNHGYFFSNEKSNVIAPRAPRCLPHRRTRMILQPAQAPFPCVPLHSSSRVETPGRPHRNLTRSSAQMEQ